MTSLGILIPKGWILQAWIAGSATAVLADIRFTNTITVGSIIVAALVVVLSGFFTFRNNMRTFWRNLAEERQEQINVLEERLSESEARYRELQEQSRTEMATVMEEQQKLRHDLKAETASMQLLLAAERAKTDLSALMEQLAEQHSEAMRSVSQGLTKQDRILELLSLTIPAESIPHDLLTDPGGGA